MHFAGVDGSKVDFEVNIEVRDLIPYGDMFLPGCVGDGGWDTGESSSGAVRYTPLPEKNEGNIKEHLPRIYLKCT